MKQWLVLGVFLLTSLPFLANDSVPVRGTYDPSQWAVFYVRGLNSTEVPIPTIKDAFPAEFPDIPVIVAKIGDGSAATTNRGMYHLLDDIYADASTNPLLAGRRVIVVGASQGGLLARAFIEMYGNKVPFTIDSFISCAGPQGGEFGLPDSWESYVDLVVWHGDTLLLQQIARLLGIQTATLVVAGSSSMTVDAALATLSSATATRDDIFDPIRQALADLIKTLVRANFPLVRIVFYNAIGQDLISVAGYWKDPLHQDEYLAFNGFLPYINNEKNHAQSQQYRENLQKLNYIVFFWAGLDCAVKPDCSGCFRFYQWGSNNLITPDFTLTDQYQNNLLGLKYLYDNGHMFIENPLGMGHGCDGPGIPIAMSYLRAIITQPALNSLADAVKANNSALVQSLVSQIPATVTRRDGFNRPAIYYAGDKPDIAQYLYAQALAAGKPLSLDDQHDLLVNACGSGCLAVAQWLIETLHFAVDGVRSELIGVADENHQTTMVNYLQSVMAPTLHQAVIQDDLATVNSMLAANPALIGQMVSGMLPIYYAGNKLAMAQTLFAVHSAQSPLLLGQLYQLLYFAVGSGCLPVVQWIIEGLYFDPLPNLQNLISLAQSNYQYAIISYLNGFASRGRTAIFTAVQNNDLATVTQIAMANGANAEQVVQGMLPIFYAGDKLAIAQYLYGVHAALGRPLTYAQMNTLLYFAFGAGAKPVAQWIMESLGIHALAPNDLATVARNNGHTEMVSYLQALGYAV